MKKIIKNRLVFFWLLPFAIGLITSFSLPPYNFIFINFITFPILLFIVFELRKYEKKLTFFIIGWLFGFGYFLSSLYWITYSLTHQDIFKILIPFALILIPAFLAIFYGLLILLLYKLDTKKRLTSILIFSLIFSIIEYLRGSILTGFPWNLISFSWSNSINSLQILSSIGTYSFNLLSITIFSLPFVFIFKNYRKIQLKVFFILIFLIGINYVYGSQVISKSNKENLNFYNYQVKIVSPKIPIDSFVNNPDPEKVLINLIKLSAPQKDVGTIFIWPEGVLTGIYLKKLNEYTDLISNSFSNNHIIVMGINTYDSNQIYNSIIVINNDLEVLGKYSKNKLVPFGEFLPFERLFNQLGLKKITYGYQSFESGKNREIISVSNGIFKLNFLPLICYEIIYSGKINFNNNSKNFTSIINVSEDGWFGNSIGPYQHFSHSIFRAIEEGKNIFRSTNNGISAYIDKNGYVVKKLESTQRGVITIERFKNSKNTLFSRFGNKIFFYFILFYISLIFFMNKKKM